MKELVFQGALDPHTPLAQGWLRVSHRKLDKKLTLPYRPYHTHDEEQKLKKGEVVECDVEVWPTCIVVPAGYRLALSVRGKDYVYPGGAGGGLKTLGNFTGVGPFKHDDPRDRPALGIRRRRHAAHWCGPKCLSTTADHSVEMKATGCNPHPEEHRELARFTRVFDALWRCVSKDGCRSGCCHPSRRRSAPPQDEGRERRPPPTGSQHAFALSPG